MAPGLNSTSSQSTAHGLDPQNLITNLTRQKIYNNLYWKESCFALSSETILEKAINIQYVGGTYGGNSAPSPFLCLILKLLQIGPSDDIVNYYITDETYKYLRCLGCFYLRLTGKAVDIYTRLELLLTDRRHLRLRGYSTSEGGWELTTVDQFIDSLLREEVVLGVTLPRLAKRIHLEEGGVIKKRKSRLDKDVRVKEELEYTKRMERVESVVGAEKKVEKEVQQPEQQAASNDYEEGEITAEITTRGGGSKKKSKVDKGYGSLFSKKKDGDVTTTTTTSTNEQEVHDVLPPPAPDSIVAWNEQRKLLGLKPLKE